MECWNPILLKERGKVPCGKCLACLQRRQNDWFFRLSKEYEVSTSALFVTLTYSDEHVPTYNGTNVLRKRDFQLFMKRFRKSYVKKVRFFACGEYGSTTLRPHYHVIIFLSDILLWSDFTSSVSNSWKYGYNTVSLVESAHFNYVAKYCTTTSTLPSLLRRKEFRPFVLCSRRPAIGSNYLTPSMVNFHRQGLSITSRLRGSNRIFSLPKYYRDRIFDDDMKESIRESTSQYFLSLDGVNAADSIAKMKYRDQQREDFTRRHLAKLNKSHKI